VRYPEYIERICQIVNLSDDFKEDEKFNKEIMLDPVDLDIVSTLNDEHRRMRAGEISARIDTAHQMVGKRTSKLEDMGLIDKEREQAVGRMRTRITERCEAICFKDKD
jgi:DNA-binding MarR family transcriptional regulator